MSFFKNAQPPGRLLVLIAALAFGASHAADEPKPVKAAKPTTEEQKPAKSAADEARPAKSAKLSVEDPKPVKTAKADADEARPSRSTRGEARGKDDEEGARLQELGAKIAEKIRQPKSETGAGSNSLVIRMKAPERPAGASRPVVLASAAPVGAMPARPLPARAAGPSELHPLVLASAQRASGPGVGHAVHWAYSGENGPQNWARLKPEFAKCGEGARQSPINIRGGIKVDLEPIAFDYRPSTFSVIDNGHTVQVNVESGNVMSVMGRRFELLQFHFHRPAEERVDGKVYEMVAHLVHKDQDGRLGVIAVLMDRGKANPQIQTVWNSLPLERGEEIGGIARIDLAALLPANRTYYTYMGSLTTPPCTEDVLWMVLKEPSEVSADQIAIFSRLYSNNARPLQSMSGRLIKESN